MQIKCPYCGESEYEVFDTIGGDGDDYTEMCACFVCENHFDIKYKFIGVEKTD